MRINFLFLAVFIFQIIPAQNAAYAQEDDLVPPSVKIQQVFAYGENRPKIRTVGGNMILDSDMEGEPSFNEEEDFTMRAENLYPVLRNKANGSAPLPGNGSLQPQSAGKALDSSTADYWQNENPYTLRQVDPEDGFVLDSAYYSNRFKGDCNAYCNAFGPGFKSNPYFLKGWISAGASISGRKPDNSVDSARRYPDTYNKFLLNQLYLTMGRNVNKNRKCFDIGGRVDLLYGSDYYFTSALGLETRKYAPDGGSVWNLDPKSAASHWNSSDGDRNGGNAARYGLSMPQLYGEVFAPFGLGTTVKFGHFYSPMGFESAMSTENFFYSHSFSMSHGEPATLTGVVVNQQITQRLIGYIGYTNGWDVWDNPRGQASILLGGKWESCSGNTGIAFSLHTGNAHDLGAFSDGDRTNYSLVLSQRISSRLMWVIQHDYGIEDNVNITIDRNGFIEPIDGKWASIVNYLFYDFSKTLSLGARFEWFQDKNGSRIASYYPYQWSDVGLTTSGKDYCNLTLGANWRPTSNLTFRPEIRWDWSDVKRHTVNGQIYGAFSDNRSKNMFTVSLEGVLRF